MAAYNALLKPYPWKGLCGDPERREAPEAIQRKAARLAEWMLAGGRCVVYTGAGISTAAGIPDFRGPRGVWTLERRRAPPPPATEFREAEPTLTHRALAALLRAGLVHFVVTQNVDNLHARSGVPREALAELHGNAFQERCERCGADFFRDFEIRSVGFRPTGRRCEREGCGGALRDHLLDWDSELPAGDVERALSETRRAAVCLCLGTSLRIRPAGNYPMRAVRRNGKPEPGKLVIVNLQRTHLDRSAALRVFGEVDAVMRALMHALAAASASASARAGRLLLPPLQDLEPGPRAPIPPTSSSSSIEDVPPRKRLRSAPTHAADARGGDDGGGETAAAAAAAPAGGVTCP